MVQNSKILITGITGYLGSHIARYLTMRLPNCIIIGTTKSLSNKDKIDQFKNVVNQKNIEIIEADMLQNKDCFSKKDRLKNIDYIFHTAAPFFPETTLKQADDKIKMYIDSTQNLMDNAIQNKVKKVVFTGSATSVIGHYPVKDKGFVYQDSYHWVEAKAINKPNEKAKILAEKVCWNALRKVNTSKTPLQTSFISLLPYFMVGPPLTKAIADTNSSCQAIHQIINNTQYGFPQVHLPMVDVRDVAQAHVNSIVLDSMREANGRYLVSDQSLWFDEIINILKEDQKKYGIKIKTRILGKWILLFGRIVNPEIKYVMPFVNQELNIDGTAFSRDFGVNYTDVKLSLKEMEKQLIEFYQTKK